MAQWKHAPSDLLAQSHGSLEFDLRIGVGTSPMEWWCCAVKRRLLLLTTFLLLIASLYGLWQFRFERIPNTPSLTLGDLQNLGPGLPPGAVWAGSEEHPVLLLTASPGQPQLGIRFALAGFPAMESLHVSFRVAAKNLKLGRHDWDDGRILIEWHSPDGGNSQETDPVCSLRDSNSSGDQTLVVRPKSGRSIPALRVEHLGASGQFEISAIEMTPVKERAIWKYGRWLLLASWVGWMWAVLAGGARRKVWKNFAVIMIWLGMAMAFAIPGPWKTLRPLVTEFEMASASAALDDQPELTEAPSRVSAASPPARPGPGVLGALPLQGGWIIQLKSQLAKLRPLLHALLLFGPTLVFAWLVGRKPAMALAFALAISIEAAQLAFGYGFDLMDVFDLASDSLGIAAALWVHRKLQARFGVPPADH
jgi:hypothetical protein